MELLERADQLELLAERVAGVRRDGHGRLVLVAGEAGAGKTTLVRALAERHPSLQPLTGACDALFTPRPLGPVMDIAAELGGEPARLAASEPTPGEMVAALAAELHGPRILVLEDLHWADEATLDVLRLLARRLPALPAVVIVTYRDEIDRAHPLRVLLGELPRAGVDRLRVDPLTPAGVALLARGTQVDPADLHARTGGNPFYVSELLAAPVDDEVPASVRDTVLARAARMAAGSRRILEAAAVVPARVEMWLLEALAGRDLSGLDDCLAAGMLQAHGDRVGFRHEIARLAVEGALPPDRRVALHRAALEALEDRGDPARLAHHAEAAGDAVAARRHATAAGDRAARLGSHREAAEQYARALRHAHGITPQERVSLLDRRAYECYLTDRIPEAIEAREAVLQEYRAVGDRLRQGDTHRWLSRLTWFTGDNPRAEAEALRAVSMLEPLGESPELARAYSNVAQLRMLAFDAAGAVQWGDRAIEMAERLEEPEILAHALNNVGTARWRAGQDRGREQLERSLDLALDGGFQEHAARAYTNLATISVSARDYAAADRYLEAGDAYCRENDLGSWELYMRGWRARSHLEQGRWDDATALATATADRPAAAAVARITALAVLGVVRARRGDPEAWPALDEALELAAPTGELQRLAPVASARAEARWLAGQSELVAGETEAALRLAIEHDDPWIAGELLVWRHRADAEGGPAAAAATPFQLELAGDVRGAAESWQRLGCPYEEAIALAGSEEDEDLHRSLAGLQALGARSAAAVIARRLRERGARNVPRGPRAMTRDNPGGLTGRQLDVLRLLAAGERNAAIAEKLFLSEKTVDHHVSAILRKLGVGNRAQAGAEARRLGIAP